MFSEFTMKTGRNRVGNIARKAWSCPMLIGLTVLLSAIVGLAEDQPLKELRTAEEKPVTFQRLASGQEDSQFVEIHGIVRTAVTSDEQSKQQLIEIATGSGRLTACVQDLKLPLQDLVDSTVRVRGVCETLFNRQ